MQSLVYRLKSSGVRTHPWGAPMLMDRELDVILDSPQPHTLPPVSQAGNPLTGGGRHRELDELLVENFWDDGVER